MHRRGSVVGAVLVLFIVVASSACGSVISDARDRREKSDRADALVDQAESLSGRSLKDGGAFSEEETECLTDGADAAGLGPEVMTDLDADEGRIELIRIMLGCIERPEAHDGFVQSQLTLLRSLGIPDLSDTEVQCLIAYILTESDDPARTFVSADGPRDPDIYQSGTESCFTAENVAAWLGEAGAGPQTYGDDARLDGIQDDCVAGNDRACDLLYLQASVESDYEQIASTCGGRSPEGDTFCADETLVDESGFAPDDHPGLHVLSVDCQDGDFTACDLLMQLTALGTEYEKIGYTCGGRIAVPAIPDCRTRFDG